MGRAMLAVEVTLSDTEPNVFDAFIAGAAGNVEIHNRAGEAVTVPVIAGEVYPISTKRILATGTTGGPVIGLTP